ncbi:hypothetical protein EAG_02964 [Camponotus floridanus]|uniref:Uncharacterized protein n=1 Tax=Camponotus floridanus TaxID=104421 RepID=E2AUC6_CAMFO|nr:hypothetical protein EAG_02964 [Camponotus floridanus]
MALVTVQRSPSVSSSPQSSDSGAGAPADDEDTTRSCKSAVFQSVYILGDKYQCSVTMNTGLIAMRMDT